MLANAAQGLRGLLMREWLLLLGILLFSFYIRVIQIDTAFFGPEQAWIAHASWKLANLQEFPTHMFNASAGFSQLPLPIYITFIPYLFSDSVFALLIYYILLNTAAVGLCWLFTRRYWGWQAAAIATIVYSCMPWAIHFSFRIWINTLLPPFVMIWAVGCGLAFGERRPRWVMLAWGAAWLAVQLHISAIILLVIVFFLTWLARMARGWRYAFVGSALALLPALPWLYALVRGEAKLGLDFSTSAGREGLRFNIQRLIDFLSASNLAENFISASAAQLGPRLAYLRYFAAIWVLLYGVAALHVCWRAGRERANRRLLYWLVALWCILPLVFTVVSYHSYTIVYYLPMLPAPCIALALALQAIPQRRPWLKAPLILGVLGLCALNLNTIRLLDDSLTTSVERGEATSHALATDFFAYPPPLEWQLELAEQIGALLASGDAAELILLAETHPDEDHLRFSWTFIYHLRSPDVRVINLSLQHTVYPVSVAAILHDTILQSQPMGYSSLWQEHARLGPYRLYLLPGNAGPTPQNLLPNQPTYGNGIKLIGYDELLCDGDWQLHWAPGPADEDSEPIHFFVHLLDAESEILAQWDLRAYDIGDWRAGDHIITTFDFGQELQSLLIKTIRVGLYSYSDEMKSFQEGIYALDEQGRPWEYAVDIPFAGECAA